MKIFTLSILASLTLAASALPASTGTVTVVTGPGRVYTTSSDPSTDDRQTNILLIDTAHSEEDFSAPGPASGADRQTLLQIQGEPGQYSNRDLEKEINRTYDQHENIESDYGKEIKREILDDRDKFNDAEDGDYDDY